MIILAEHYHSHHKRLLTKMKIGIARLVPSESSVSGDDETGHAEVDTIVERALNIIRPSRLGRVRLFRGPCRQFQLLVYACRG
jgi:hypothetical protein